MPPSPRRTFLRTPISSIGLKANSGGGIAVVQEDKGQHRVGVANAPAFFAICPSYHEIALQGHKLGWRDRKSVV